MCMQAHRTEYKYNDVYTVENMKVVERVYLSERTL